MKPNQSVTEPEQLEREINPRFRQRLPKIMRKVCDIFLVIEPEMKSLAVHLRELQEYMDFEIEKTKLAIQTEAWKSRCDREKLEADSEWLAKLEELRAKFDVDVMTAPATLIRELFKQMKETFGGVSQD